MELHSQVSGAIIDIFDPATGKDKPAPHVRIGRLVHPVANCAVHFLPIKRIVKLDCKDWGVKGGFGKIGEGDVDWPEVRKALREIGYTGWATAEVEGGDKAKCGDILAQMRRYLLGAS